MGKLRLNELPYSLKTMVFSNSQPGESLKFLKTSRELRHFVLNHGTFPKKLKEIRFTCTNPYMNWDNLLCEKMLIVVYTETQSYSFIFGEPNTNSLFSLKPSDSPLFRKLRNFKKLSFCYETQITYALTSRILVTDFISKPLSLLDFSLFAPSSALIVPIFRHITTKIEREFRFEVDLKQRLNVIKEIPEFFDEKLRDCQRIRLLNLREETLRDCLDHRHGRTHNYRQLTILSPGYSGFVETVEGILVNGIPSRFPWAAVEILHDDAWHEDEEDEPMANRIKSLADCLEVEEELALAEVLPRFPDDFDLYSWVTMMSEDKWSKATFYRRRFSSTSEYFYVFLKRTRVYMKFYATCVPVL